MDEADNPRWTCPECHGSGTDDGTEVGEPCAVCDGDGVIEKWMMELD